jgi:ring-1,2-phenylacetyl-CoA epoxidase subunit PaaB
LPGNSSQSRKLQLKDREFRQMSDTQWPRFQVFLQENAGGPYLDVGSVHAPDAEMALQNARDVFARRPDCHELWVVPVNEIFSKTRAELQSWDAPSQSDDRTGQEYRVFCKTRSAGAAQFAGTVPALNAQAALAAAIAMLEIQPEPYTWWVFPSAAVTSSAPEDIDPMFSSAYNKPFRDSASFHVLTAMRKARQEKE